MKGVQKRDKVRNGDGHKGVGDGTKAHAPAERFQS